VFNRLSLRLLLVPGILFVLVGCAASRTAPLSEIRNGALNIQKGIAPVELVGDRAFWPGEFVPPGISFADFHRFEYFPAAWDTYGPEQYSSYGYGSYAVRVTGLDPGALYALRVPGYSSAVRVYANGAELFHAGMPSSTRDGEQVGWDNAVVQLPSSGISEVTVVIHLSNHYDRGPASSDPILIGSIEQLTVEHTHSRLLMIIPFAAILAMGAFFISLFAFHHDETACLWLGLMGIVFSLRIICYDEYMLQDIFSFISSDMMFRLGYCSFSLGVLCFVGFVRSLYPEHVPRPVVFLVIGVSGTYALMNLVTPVPFFTSVLGVFQIVTLAAAVFVLYAIFRAIRAGKEGSVLFLAGFGFFFLVVIHDILVSQRMISGFFMAHYGIMIIIACMSVIIVRRFSKAFASVEFAKGELERTNVSLARFVPNEFLKSLGKQSITEIYLGDNIRKDMCVMFVHLGVDMSLAGAVNRQVMLDVFNSILLKVNPVIQKYNGFIDKYLLDGLMVLFPDDPARTALCALELGRVAGEFNEARKSKDLPLVRFAAGIHCGSLMLGTIGDAERMDSTVISDVVNVACRIKQLAVSRNLGILVSGAVLESAGSALGGKCAVITHGDVILKGKDKSVRIFEVREP
jgi:class 3 adenylate cyclase